MSSIDQFSSRSLILAIYLPTFLLAFGHGVVNPTLSLYIKSFDLSYSMTMFVIAIAVLGNIPAGLLVGRIGYKRSMVLGTVILSASSIGIGLATTIYHLVFLQLFSGVGAALWSLSRHAFMTERIPITSRGRSLAIFGGVNRIASFLGQIVVIFLGENLRLPFFVYAATAICTSTICYIFVEDYFTKPVTIDWSSQSLKNIWGNQWNLIKTNFTILITAGFAQICIQTIRRGRTLLVPLFANDIVGLAPKLVRKVVAVSSAVDMLMFPVAGTLMDKYGRKSSMIPGFSIFATGILAMAFTQNFWPLLLSTIFMGIGNGLCSGTMMTLGADLAPADNVNGFLSWWRVTGDIGGNVGPLLVGGLADLWHLRTSIVFLSIIGYLAVLIFWRLVPETLPRHSDDRL